MLASHRNWTAPVLGFTAGLTLLTALVFGLISAFGVRFDAAAGALTNPGRVTASAGARRASAVLVVVETALAIVLLTGAGLVLRSFARLLAVDPGFQTEGVLTLDIGCPRIAIAMRGRGGRSTTARSATSAR